ncbi:MAG: penicillin acylase family protein [Longimicrobiales bacterium]
MQPAVHIALLAVQFLLPAGPGAEAQAPPAGTQPTDSMTEAAIAARVEIVRTEYGIPHVYAEDLQAFGFAMGWLQLEDYGADVAVGLVRARGEYALHVGRDSIDGDFENRETYLRAVETHALLEPATRSVYAGFAAGVNHYVRLHPEEMPAWMTPTFTAYDAHARDVQSWSRGDAASFVRGLERRGRAGAGEGGASDHSGGLDAAPSFPPSQDGRGWAAAPVSPTRDLEREAYDLDGSNAWAFTADRTTTGNAILLRNPHLTWGAGYYEAHVVVPGALEFYGDFRIGGAFGIIGGFNRRLGWATTNNYPEYSQVYALAEAPGRLDHYVLDGIALPLEERTTTVRYRTRSGGVGEESRSTWWTSAGPVVHRADGWIYVLKDPRHDEFRRGEQFLRMMRSSTLDEWLEVMRMRAHPSSNFTYADADGNAVHYYNARLPQLPHGPTGDTAAVARTSDDIWTELVPFERLPLYVNPPGGYVQQANDTPDYTNLHVPMDRDTMPANLPPRRLRLRSQLSLQLVHETGPISLEDVVTRKHTPRMLLAERTADELVAILRAAKLGPPLLEAVDVLDRWDRTAHADSRGGVLFKAWWEAYEDAADPARLHARTWSPLAPTSTPRGVGDPQAAVVAFRAAVDSLGRAGIPVDAAWGEVHRLVRGSVDAPVSGCEPTLGCFRALSFEDLADGRRAANRGDAWVFAVEFADVPRAYTVLAYGQSPDPESPHFDDQAGLFARGEMKPIRWTRADVDAGAVRRYRPGAAR